MRYEWEEHPDDDLRTLHVDCRLFAFWDNAEGCPLPDSLPERQAELVRELRGIHGVRTASVRLYSVVIEKARLVHWDEICPRVVLEVATWCGEPAEVAYPRDGSRGLVGCTLLTLAGVQGDGD